MKKLPPTAPIRRTVMNRSTSHAIAFGLGFLTGALLLAMLMGLQVRVARAQAAHFRAEAEAQQERAERMMDMLKELMMSLDRTEALRVLAEDLAKEAEKPLAKPTHQAAEKKD
jgi:hypothetical protein